MPKRHKQGVYEKYLKRLLDIILSLLFIVLFWWVYVILALLIKINIGSPIFFKQPRPGKNEKIFNLVKFRTMTNERDEQGNLLPDELRLTKFGKWLRATSLDELPEIFLILNGCLTWVGPRPLLVSYLPIYNKRQKRRHEVKPGLTGYAQVNGRNGISWEEKFELDIWYVDHITFFTDVKILFKTISVILKKDGISSDTSATMEYFEESKKE